MLVAVAGRLGMRLRSEDTVARFGGDEFTVLLQNVGGPSGATEAADRILEDLREPFLLEGREHHVTASIGIALSTLAEEDPTPILLCADEAMYMAKQRGGACYALQVASLPGVGSPRLAVLGSRRPERRGTRDRRPPRTKADVPKS